MAYSKYDRTNFLAKSIAKDSEEWDFILNNWDLFVIKRPLGFDSVKYEDMQRPDILSYRIYRDSSIWWILCKFNQIDDVWNDLYVGMDLLIPDIEDINDFYKNVRRRIRKQ